MGYQKVEINCPECGCDLIYEFKNMADWGTGYNHNQKCESCNCNVAITLTVGCPSDIGVPEEWRPK